jgi:asparagine synthase (glutamine-hydrolysing)
MIRNGHRILLSGIGGDEFLGGVPTPIPELEDWLARGRLITLWQRLQLWALVQRRPWVHLLRDAIIGFLPLPLQGRDTRFHFGSWLEPGFVTRQGRALSSYAKKWTLLGPLPSFQENLDAVDAIARQLGCRLLTPGFPYERRYPYLDRDLLEFLFAIPRDQLIRPGERRSLMRRALKGIVPEEILQRKRKAFVIRSLVTTAESKYRILSAKHNPLAAGLLGVVNPKAFLESLRAAGQGKDVPLHPLLRAVAIEEWLETLSRRGLLRGPGVSAFAARHSRDTKPDLIHAVR